MNYYFFILESLHFTKKTFFVDRIRSIIFLLLGMAGGIVSLHYNAVPHMENFRICWQVMYSWWIWFGLLVLWLLISTVIAGYMIRIFRDPVHPPSFDNVKKLIHEGIIAEILIAVWAVPALIWMFTFSSPLVLIVLLVFLILMFPASLFLFATTGDFRESLRISNILSAIQNPGWGVYLAAWGIAFLCFLLVMVVTGIFWFALTLFPLVPALLISLVKYGIFGYATLLFNIFFARFFATVLRNG
ncbi:MAG: hypothetical protein A4E35_01098 [Methanoregula sp. PtaU1.Bin051]|nr:MAG: hypothetical protein A4E35_01098 [Methanoregula sp. PtaU1.Bin051]